MAKSTHKLSAAMEGKYLAKGLYSPRFSYNGKEYNLTTMSEKAAELLIAQGFTRLVKAKPKKPRK